MVSLPVLAALLSGAAAHYNYPQMIYQGTVQSTPWSQVRQWAGYENYTPVTSVLTNDIRCNVNASLAAQTLSVAAGSTVGFTASPDIYHPGPILVYMGMVPAGETAATWDGSGTNWFKIWEVPPKVTSSGLDWPYSDAGATSVTFTIPPQTPNGQYLLRFEQIGLHVAYSEGGAQFYLSCGQIQVTNGGSGKPSPLVSFPGAYSPTDPGILLSLYSPIPTNYTMPGPAVWPAGGSTAPSSSVATTATLPPSHSTTTLVTKTSSTPTTTGAVVAQYGQCGGQGYTGPTTCAAGFTCKAENPYYSQCT